MAIEFPCQSCGSRFEVDDRFAGKAGRCKHCGARMTIPSIGGTAAPQWKLAPAAAVPAPAGVAAAKGRVPRWVDAVNSQVGLAPLSTPAVAAVPVGRRTSPLDDASFSGLYKVQSAPELPPMAGPGRATGPLFNFYRRRIGGVQRLFRWLNDAAYFVSVPFIILVLLGAMIRNRPLALIGATAVVLLNIGRLATGLANLVAIPFKDGPAQGVMFLIPPLTFVYIAQHYKRLRKALKRVVGPAATIAMVLLVFAFVPWLSRSEQAAQGNLKDRLNAGLEGVREDIADQAGKVRNLNTSQLKRKAEGVLKRIAPGGSGSDGSQTGEPDGTPRSLGGSLKGALDEIRSVRPGGP
jgi:hypothetical protein